MDHYEIASFLIEHEKEIRDSIRDEVKTYVLSYKDDTDKSFFYKKYRQMVTNLVIGYISEKCNVPFIQVADHVDYLFLKQIWKLEYDGKEI